MKTIVTVSFMMILAISAQAGIIHEIQTGDHPDGTYLTPTELTVVAVMYNGIFVSEAPLGAYDGIWVYTGTHDWVVGNLVSVCAIYVEYNGLSELDVVGAGTWGSVTFANGYGSDYEAPIPAPSMMTAAELLADEEMWESCMITISDGMEITDTSLGYGEWATTCVDGNELRFDDFWVEFDNVPLNDCYDNATGIYYFSYDNFKLEAFADGVTPVSCSTDTEALSLSGIKALYR